MNNLIKFTFSSFEELAHYNYTTVTFNEELNGIEIRFVGIPSEEIRNELKSNGFRWSRKQKMWYAKDTEERRVFVNTLQSSDIETQQSTKQTAKETQQTQEENPEPEAIVKEVRHNKRMNGIEIEFESDPNETQKQQLKQLRFRYHSSKNMWYTKYDNEKMEFAEGLKAG